MGSDEFPNKTVVLSLGRAVLLHHHDKNHECHSKLIIAMNQPQYMIPEAATDLEAISQECHACLRFRAVPLQI